MTKRKRRDADAANDEPGGDDEQQEERDTSTHAALERVLAFAESRGEEYFGACEDHGILRAAIESGELPGDKRVDPPA